MAVYFGQKVPPIFKIRILSDCYLALKNAEIVNWRRVEDSNLRGDFSPTAFRVRRIRPLCQPSLCAPGKSRTPILPLGRVSSIR